MNLKATFIAAAACVLLASGVRADATLAPFYPDRALDAFQEIPAGRPLPREILPLLHVRMNLQTGLKEAKYLAGSGEDAPPLAAATESGLVALDPEESDISHDIAENHFTPMLRELAALRGERLAAALDDLDAVWEVSSSVHALEFAQAGGVRELAGLAASPAVAEDARVVAWRDIGLILQNNLEAPEMRGLVRRSELLAAVHAQLLQEEHECAPAVHKAMLYALGIYVRGHPACAAQAAARPPGLRDLLHALASSASEESGATARELVRRVDGILKCLK